MNEPAIFKERQNQIHRKGEAPFKMDCDRESLAGAVSQRACVFCGSRVVLYPIADALHLVHGPIGCAAYTWDIRGALVLGSGAAPPELLHRPAGNGRHLRRPRTSSIRPWCELIDRHQPKAAFVYSTCIVGLIGDDLEGGLQKGQQEKGIPVLPVQSEGFKGNKRDGYLAACEAMFRLVGTGDITGISPNSVNILGDFNLAGEIWIIREYLARMGVEVVANITGDGRVDDLRRAHGAALNLVQCSGSTLDLAKMMEETYGIPHIRVSYFGVEDMAESLYAVARFFNDPEMMARTRELVREELASLFPKLREFQQSPGRQEGRHLRGRRLQGLLPGQGLPAAGHAGGPGGLPDRHQEDYQELHDITDDRHHHRG